MSPPKLRQLADETFGADSTRALWLLVAALIVVLIATAWLAYRIGQPLPPSRIGMAGATPGSPFDVIVQQYRERLRAKGIEVFVPSTAGTDENLARLRDPYSGVVAGLAATGAQAQGDEKVLDSLGGMFFAPIFLFRRADVPIEQIADLRGCRVSAGPPGFFSTRFAVKMLELGGIFPANSHIEEIENDKVIAALTSGQVDAAFIPGNLNLPTIRDAFRRDDLRVVSLSQAEAIAKRIPELHRIVLPRGAFDLATNQPPADVVSVAAMISLVVRRDLHPAIQYVLLDAAKDIHGPPGTFNRLGEFPSQVAGDLPLSEEAERFYRSGKPWLQSYVGFWMAVFLERLATFLLPVIAVLVPAIQFLPKLFVAYYRRKISRWRQELRRLAADMRTHPDKAALAERYAPLFREIDNCRMPRSLEFDVESLREKVDGLRTALGQ